MMRWLMAVTAALALGALGATNDHPFIGLEGRAVVSLPRPDYQPRPVDDRTDLILRIEAVRPASSNAWNYDLHFVGLEPRVYPLSDYLLHPDGSPAAELTAETVRVASILPAEHDGSLVPMVQRALPWMGGYRFGLLLLGLLWGGGLVAFAMYGRKRKIAPPPPPA